MSSTRSCQFCITAARIVRTLLAATVTIVSGEMVEIADGDVTWRFERSFLQSNWSCIFGAGCRGILPDDATDLKQGCCSYGAHLGDGTDGRAEALNIAAYASVLTTDQWQFQSEFDEHGPRGLFSDDRRNHTRVIDGACIFLNRPGFEGGSGCALHVGAVEASESPVEWKPSVCWQLPIRVDWADQGADGETATVRRWGRSDWGEFGETMAWCCTEREEGGEAYCGDESVIESMADELTALTSTTVMVELRRRLG